MELVGDLAREHAPGELRSAFDHRGHDPARRQHPKRRDWLDAALGGGGRAENFDSAFDELLLRR
jgi:hypothetical protein